MLSLPLVAILPGAGGALLPVAVLFVVLTLPVAIVLVLVGVLILLALLASVLLVPTVLGHHHLRWLLGAPVASRRANLRDCGMFHPTYFVTSCCRRALICG